MIQDPFFLLVLAVFMVINISAFVYVLVDKSRATRGYHRNRVPEAKLLFFSICFGALGVLLSMHAFRHKTKTLFFVIGVPLALVQNAVVLYVIYLLNV